MHLQSKSLSAEESLNRLFSVPNMSTGRIYLNKRSKLSLHVRSSKATTITTPELCVTVYTEAYYHSQVHRRTTSSSSSIENNICAIVIYKISLSAILCRSPILLRSLLQLLPFRYLSIIILTPSFILSVILFLLSPYSIRTVFRIPTI